MNYKKGIFNALLLLTILSTYHIKPLAGKKEILIKGTCFDLFESTWKEPGVITPLWSRSKQGTCLICNSLNTEKSWLVTKVIETNGSKLINVDVNLIRASCRNCASKILGISILHEEHRELQSSDARASSFLKTLKLFTGLNLSETAAEKATIYHFQFEPKSSIFSLVFLSAGICIRIPALEVSYFVCEKKISKLVNLPRTLAPASRFTRVNVTCAANTLNPGNEKPHGLCSSQGTWHIVSPCICQEGYTLATVDESCQKCSRNTYKDVFGNKKCTSCPLNSFSGLGETRCSCKPNFYRFRGNNYTHPCYGIPSSIKESDIKFTARTESRITLLWLPAETHGSENVQYDIECGKCPSESNVNPCELSCGRGIRYEPLQFDIEITNVTVLNLERDTEYQFTIYSKNNNSARIDRRNWGKTVKIIRTKECPKNTYEDIIGYKKCTPCPLNSLSGSGEKTCSCKPSFYRFRGNNYTHPCYGVPSSIKESDIKFTAKTESTITLLWPPAETHGLQNVKYDIECRKCQSDSNIRPCELSCGRGIRYEPSQFDIEITNVTVLNLQQDTDYQFTIYSKNNNSAHIDRGNWGKTVKIIRTKEASNQDDGAQDTNAVDFGVIVGIVVSGVGVLFLVAIIVLIRNQRRNKRFEQTVKENEVVMRNVNRTLDENIRILHSDYNNDDGPRDIEELGNWEIDQTQLIVFDKVLGGGYFGVVKEGLFTELQSNGEKVPVAVKTLKAKHGQTDWDELLREFEILKYVNDNASHPNILTLIGACTQTAPILLVTELCSRGNLKRLLRKTRVDVEADEEYKNIYSTLTERQLIYFAAEIARGMLFLFQKKVIHRDIATRNILLSDSFVPKIADFGLARRVDVSEHYIVNKNKMLPAKWMAMEALEESRFVPASDTWSYGILLWEICTLGEEPYSDVSPYEILSYLRKGHRLVRPSHCSVEIFSLMERCWLQDPEKRPCFKEIINSLQSMLKDNEKSYVNVKTYQDENEPVLMPDNVCAGNENDSGVSGASFYSY